MGAWSANAAVNVRADVPERNGTVGLAMVVVEAGQHFTLSSGRTEHPHAGLDGCRSRIIELESIEIAWKNLCQFFHEFGFHRRGEIMRVHERVRRFCNAFADLRVAMTECGHIDARGKIDVFISIHITQHTGLAGLEAYREQFHLSAEPLEMLGASVV